MAAMLKSNETKVSDNRPQWLKNPGHRMWVVVSVESNYGADDLSSNPPGLPDREPQAHRAKRQCEKAADHKHEGLNLMTQLQN